LQTIASRPKHKIERIESKTDLEAAMIYTIVSVLVVLWLIGFLSHFGGSFIHGLLVLAAIVFLFDLISGRRVA